MTLLDDERLAWLGLHLIPGLGSALFRKLVGFFGSPEGVFAAGAHRLTGVRGVSDEMARVIAGRKFSVDPAEEMRESERIGARILCYGDGDYPSLLRELHSPPMVLYMKGADIPAEALLFAMVGSRNPTHYGLRSAESLAAGLAARGAWVVSGLARGIDSASHWGALLAGGFTVAVMGTGIDRVYPPENGALAERIAGSGCLVSEFPLKSPPEPRNFPIRNRIISGLSHGVVVVEAAKSSGSLITASAALEQGRDVFAVPGSISSFESTGTHFLIKQGAKLVEHAEDVLEEYGRLFAGPAAGRPEPVQARVDVGAQGRAVYDRLGEYPLHIDEIVRGTGMDAGTVSGILLDLELRGLIRQHRGKFFTRDGR